MKHLTLSNYLSSIPVKKITSIYDAIRFPRMKKFNCTLRKLANLDKKVVIYWCIDTYMLILFLWICNPIIFILWMLILFFCEFVVRSLFDSLKFLFTQYLIVARKKKYFTWSKTLVFQFFTICFKCLHLKVTREKLLYLFFGKTELMQLRTPYCNWSFNLLSSKRNTFLIESILIGLT